MNYSPATIKAIETRFEGRYSKFFMQDPESYLGPNYAAFINFWTFHDSLNERQLTRVSHLYSSNYHKIRYDHTFISRECRRFLDEIESLILDADGSHIWSMLYLSETLATKELIVMHKLLEGKMRNYEMPFLKLYEGL